MKMTAKILLAGLWVLALAGCAAAGAAQSGAQPVSGLAEESGAQSGGGQAQAAGLSAEGNGAEPAERDAGIEPITAMYVPMGNAGAYILVDQNYGTVFTVTMPENMYGLNGEKITQQDLTAGNILEIEGNGLMLESYPGQYPGVTAMRIVQQGSPEDIAVYQELIDTLYQEPDLTVPPELTAEYRIPLAMVAARVARGGYQWEYIDENGETVSTVACGAHPLQWGEELDQNPLKIGEAADIRLLFSTVKPEEVQALCWPESQRMPAGGGDIPEGEKAVIEKEEGEFILRQAQPGYVYQIAAIFPGGDVEYAFLTE